MYSNSFVFSSKKTSNTMNTIFNGKYARMISKKSLNFVEFEACLEYEYIHTNTQKSKLSPKLTLFNFIGKSFKKYL